MNYQEEPPPPLANVEAEAALLGALMLDNRAVGTISAIVSEEHFFEPLHGRIFRIIRKFYEAGKVANPVTLRPLFEMDRAMRQVGGPGYLAQLTGSGASLIAARDMAEQVRDLAHLRLVRDSVFDGLEAIEEQGGLEPFLATVEIAIARASGTIRQVEMLSTKQMLELAENRVERAIEHGIPGASCKLIPDVDTLIGKLEPGQMTIVAGRPGMGKSTLAVSAALGYALNGHPGLYALCESSNEMFSLKLTADMLHAARRPILFKTLKEGMLSNMERQDVARAKEVADSLPVTWAHMGREDVKRLEAMVARESSRLKREGRCLEFVVVDYLQLLTANGRHRVGDDRGRVNAVSEALLSIAQKHETHVIALSQLSRQVEQREDKKPRLSDLRESGRLEEDADNVLMVYREEYYLEKDPRKDDPKKNDEWAVDMGHARGKIELIAAKTRFGFNATRKAQFLGEYSAIRSSAYLKQAEEEANQTAWFDEWGMGDE